ncbi:MAG: hypothetical protein AUG51_04990 [Acidobacteria bacterium 13_1_20CM_3_53_8]|nr:MAG: hypothetical protein AUG51_04990 [Acidobacteria bacterium 13_1_20CM_3_53_8]
MIYRRMKSSPGARTPLLILFACLMTLSLLATGWSGKARTQEARPRRAATPTPTASPQPTRSIVVQPTATPTPSPRPTVIRRPDVQVDMPAPPTMIVHPRAEATPSPSPSPDNGEEVDPDAIVRVNTDLVTLNVRVVDRNNRPINDARQNQFHVFENGVEQPIEFFSTEEVPITYGLVVDNSGSMRSQIDTVIEAAKTIINSNRPGDETFIERFVDREKIEVVRDFTANRQDLMDGLDDMIIEGGQTAVIDAVYLGADHVANYKKSNDQDDRRRRALILVTDGEDRESFYNQDRLFQALREEDVQIFVIGFVNELDREGGLIRKSPRDRSVALINRLASETGGRAFFPNSLSDLPDIARQITHDLRTQYVVSYNPTNKLRDGSFRPIRVAVDDAQGQHRVAITRTGRYATPSSRPTTNAPATRGGSTARPTPTPTTNTRPQTRRSP